MGKQPILSDDELLENYYSGKDNHWLGELLNRYNLLLFGVAMKYLRNEEEARDIVQQVFMKVLEELEKYRVTHFKSWLFTIVRNQCLMKLRQQIGKTVQPLEEFKHPIAEELDPDIIQEEGKVFQWLKESLEELNPEQRECVSLFYLEKLSYQQIAARTGYTGLQVKSYIQNGKRNLRILIEQKKKIMNEHLKDLLSGSGKPVDPQQLIAYLKGELPPAEAQQIEEQLAAGEFEQEALEGLEAISNKAKLDSINATLHHDLQQKIRQRRRKKKFPLLQTNEPLTYAVMLIVLLLMVLAYWIVSRALSQ